MARRCTDVRLLTWAVAGEFRVSSGLCQIAAPYWILGLITAVYNLLTYLNGVPHVILAMLDSARRKLGAFLCDVVQVSVEFQFLIKDYAEVARFFSWWDCRVV